jgi:hypothetical protein
MFLAGLGSRTRARDDEGRKKQSLVLYRMYRVVILLLYSSRSTVVVVVLRVSFWDITRTGERGLGGQGKVEHTQSLASFKS